MTNEDLLRTALEERLQKAGENDFSVRQLRQQLASLEYFKKVPPLGTHQFHVGARAEASEDLQPGEYQEDMYGNPIMSPEEKAEEKRQQRNAAVVGIAREHA